GRHDRRQHGLAEAGGRMLALDEVNFHLGRVTNAQGAVVVVVALLNRTVFHGDFQLQHGADTVHHRAFRLVFCTTAVDDGTHVTGNGHLVYGQALVGIHAYFRHLGD